jgi:hypothetical protein
MDCQSENSACRNQILDLRFNGKLNREISLKFNKIAYHLRAEFNNVVAELSIPFSDNIDWWVEGPACRNTFSSSFFHYYCCIHLLIELAKDNALDYQCIFVDSVAFKNIIEKQLEKLSYSHLLVEQKISFSLKIKGYYRQYFSVYFLLFKKCLQIFISRLSRKQSITPDISQSLILVDTFMIPKYVNNDRWYGCLWENLEEELKADTYFIPTLVMTPISKMNYVYKSLRSNARNFLIKEDYLTFSDCWFSLKHWRIIKKFSIKSIKISGIDISSLIVEELKSNTDKQTVFESLLTYRSIARLNEKGIHVRLAIDWFEGQVIDKAWNLGFKHFYPNIKRIGYRAFESFPFYLCSYPIEAERKAGAIPDVMAVQGRETVNTVREFLPDLDTIVIPSFKSDHVWRFKFEASKNKEFRVLVTLPISLIYSKQIIDKLIYINRELETSSQKIQFIIKPHPTYSLTELKKTLFHDIPTQISVTAEKSLEKVLKTTDLLVTEASSTCLEAMGCGIPVVIMVNDTGLTFDPIPKKVSKILYRKVTTTKQFVEVIKYYTQLSPNEMSALRNEGETVRKDYFEPITKEGINRFMDITTEGCK